MKTLGFVLAALLALGFAGCGDDDDDTVVDASTTVDARSADSSTATPDSSTGLSCAAPVSAAAAATFCAQYQTTCGFGGTNRFADLSACVSMYGAFVANRQRCATEHLCNAGQAGQATLHCPHATGQSPCN